MKCPLARTWANFISHRAGRDISQCALAHYFTFCKSKTFHYMLLCLQMQCLSRKKDEEFLQFFVLSLLVGILIFILLYRRSPSRCLFCFALELVCPGRTVGRGCLRFAKSRLCIPRMRYIAMRGDESIARYSRFINCKAYPERQTLYFILAPS